MDSFYTLSMDKTSHLLTSSPHLDHIVIEWPLVDFRDPMDLMEPKAFTIQELLISVEQTNEPEQPDPN